MLNSIAIIVLGIGGILTAWWQTIQDKNNKNVKRQLRLLEEEIAVLQQQNRSLQSWFLEVGMQIASIKDQLKDK